LGVLRWEIKCILPEKISTFLHLHKKQQAHPFLHAIYIHLKATLNTLTALEE